MLFGQKILHRHTKLLGYHADWHEASPVNGSRTTSVEHYAMSQISSVTFNK